MAGKKMGNGAAGKVDAQVTGAAMPAVSAASKAVEPVTAAPAVKLAAAPAVAERPAAVAAVPAATVPAAPERERAAVRTLVAKLRDLDADVARDAAATLGQLPADDEAIAALSEAVCNKAGYFHAVVRAAAAASLGKLKSPRGVEALLQGTRDPMAEASDEAVQALGMLGDRRAIPTLEAIVKNADGFYLDNVRQSAQRALAQVRAAR